MIRETDKERNGRIRRAILTDAYTASERAVSWCYHLEREVTFPFRARCTHAVLSGVRVSVRGAGTLWQRLRRRDWVYDRGWPVHRHRSTVRPTRGVPGIGPDAIRIDTVVALCVWNFLRRIVDQERPLVEFDPRSVRERTMVGRFNPSGAG